MFSGRSPQFIQYRVNSLISYAFSVKPSKRSVWKMCLYMYICVALYLLVNKLLSYPSVRTNYIHTQTVRHGRPGNSNSSHDDVIKWKHSPRYWSFVRRIHRSLVNSPKKRPVTRTLDVFFDLRLNKSLSNQSWGWWFETPSCSLERHCNAQYDSRSIVFHLH